MKQALLLAVLLLPGCSLLPKKVEFFQDEVGKVPVAKPAERETQKQAAALAADKAEETLRAAISESSSTNVLSPAADSALLTATVSTSLGPPLTPWRGDTDALARKLDSAVAKLDARLEKFRTENDANAGKKIEGTGLFQIPYFVWLGIVGVFIFAGFVVLSVLWAILKVYALSNPPVAIGLRAAQMGGNMLSRAFSQLVKGGENFKNEVTSQFDEATAQRILALFAQHHQQAQDQDIQTVVAKLTQ